MADYLSVAEAAAELGLSPTAVRALIKKDELAVLLVNRQGNSLFVAVNPK